MGRFTSIPLPKQPMESQACSKMKSMTIIQGAVLALYKINHDDINEKNRKAWAERYAMDKLARKIIGDSLNANT